MKDIIISPLITEKIEVALNSYGYNCRFLEKNEAFVSELGYHADINVAAVGDALVTSEQFYLKNKALFEKTKKRTILSKTVAREGYPNDCVFNAFAVGNTLFGSKDMAKELVAELRAVEYTKQGYAKCSCAVCDTVVVTADVGIMRALSVHGIPALLVGNDTIGLDGFSCGFIGGASFFDENKLFFFGDLSSHPDGERIKSFLDGFGIKTVSLCEERIYDYGGAILL